MRKIFMVLFILPLVALAQIQRTPYGLIANHAGQSWLFVAIEDTNNASPQTVTITSKVEPRVFKNGTDWRITFPAPATTSGSPLYDSLIAQRDLLERRITKLAEEHAAFEGRMQLKRAAGQDTSSLDQTRLQYNQDSSALGKQKAAIELQIYDAKKYLPAPK